jgi:hypothetical protein
VPEEPPVPDEPITDIPDVPLEPAVPDIPCEPSFPDVPDVPWDIAVSKYVRLASISAAVSGVPLIVLNVNAILYYTCMILFVIQVNINKYQNN